MMTGNPYTEQWRTAVRGGVRASAEALVPVLTSFLPPNPSVIDVGCGEGWFLREFERSGARAVGIEAAWAKVHAGLTVEIVDLQNPPYPRVDGRFDAAVCLEVGEHLTPSISDTLVAWLCDLAPVVFFSAAVPGQGGPGHVNERWPGDWAARFAAAGYGVTGALRWKIWDDDRIEPWYRQNLLVCAEDLAAIALDPDGCAPVVHPGMWRWKGHR